MATVRRRSGGLLGSRLRGLRPWRYPGRSYLVGKQGQAYRAKGGGVVRGITSLGGGVADGRGGYGEGVLILNESGVRMFGKQTPTPKVGRGRGKLYGVFMRDFFSETETWMRST